MSSITQAKAEAQKLIKRYNQLQAEAKIADPSEATRKAAEADKLVSQISALQLAITKLQTRDKEAAVQKKTTTSSKTAISNSNADRKTTTSATTSTAEKIKRATSSEKIVLEDRINRLEEAQNKTRAQIEQLTRAKAELTRLKQETEKSAATIKKRRANDEKLQQELAKLIEKKEAEHQALKKELDAVRQQAQKDAEMLKVQRDAARAMMERQKQLEKEQSLASQRRGSNKGLVIGTGIVAIIALILGILLTSWFLSSEPPSGPDSNAIAENKQIKEEKPVTKEQPKTKEIKAMETYRDQLKSNPGPLMVKLPKGTFKMGSKSSLPYPDERPQHEVTLESFSIGKYEVTFEEYGWFAVATGRQLPSDNGWGRGKRPVVNVSWYDAVAYTEWLSEQTGYLYRLPSEREWEYAASAGTETTYWWGYKLERGQANCGVCGSQWDGRQTAPVGSFAPNPFSIYDTIGNVMEWTISCFRPTYQDAPPTGNIWEWGRKECSRRVVRSSSYKSYERSLRTTKRNKYKPTVRMDTLGFRVVRAD